MQFLKPCPPDQLALAETGGRELLGMSFSLGDLRLLSPMALNVTHVSVTPHSPEALARPAATSKQSSAKAAHTQHCGRHVSWSWLFCFPVLPQSLTHLPGL